MRGIGCGMWIAIATVAQAQSPPEKSRGELLYTTHCIGCHTTQVNWREKKLASDWASLTAQVDRWQKKANLGWSGEDVDAVVRYLNAAYYRLPAPAVKSIGERRLPFHIAHGD
jgi:mono/diheme cytochrome c family protein